MYQKIAGDFHHLTCWEFRIDPYNRLPDLHAAKKIEEESLTHPPEALLIATMDTKGREALFISNCLERAGTPVRIMDAGIQGKSPAPIDISRTKVVRAGGRSLAEVQGIGHEGKDRIGESLT